MLKLLRTDKKKTLGTLRQKMGQGRYPRWNLLDPSWNSIPHVWRSAEVVFTTKTGKEGLRAFKVIVRKLDNHRFRPPRGGEENTTSLAIQIIHPGSIL